MKKIALLFILVFLPMLACADAVEIDGIYYTLVPDSKVAEVTSDPNKYTGDITIPTTIEYDGEVYDVTAIGDNAFYDCKNITSVTIGNSVESIGHYAFAGCGRLASLTIPNSVGTIGNSAFSLCNGLRSLTIGNSVTSIGRSAFNGCSGLSSVIIPNGVTSIGDYAFQQCIGMASVTIPNSVTSIGYGAFLGCGLTSVTIPNSVTSIGDKAFGDCQRVTFIIVEDGNPVYDSRNNSNAIIETASNRLIAGCNNTTIPNGVTSIGNHAFQKCLFLTSVIIPSSVTSIGDGAFRDCRAVREIVNKAQTPPVCGIQPFYGINKNECKLYVPAASVSAYQAVEPWKNFKEIVAFPAQDNYRPLLEEGKVWTYHYYNDGTGKSYDVTRVIDGDTIIGGLTYKRICDKIGGNYLFALREEGKQVYIVYNHQETPSLLYDFSKNKGEMACGFRVADVDTIDIDGARFRRMRIIIDSEWKGEEVPWWATYWIEGVGSEYSLETNYMRTGNFYNLESCQINGRTYTQQELLKKPSKPTEPSMLCDGRSWKYEYSEMDWESLTEEQKLNGDYQSLGRVTYDYWLRVEGDELFDGRQCKKIVYDGFNGTGLYGYGYEDNGRVMVYVLEDEPAFCAPFPSEQWVMLYDFNVAKDSHCDMGAFWIRDFIVSVEGTVKVSGTDKRFIGLSDAQHPTWPLRYAVDGIGCSFGLYEFQNIIDNGSSSRFVGCYDGDVCIFSAEDFNALTTPKDAYRPFVEEGKVWKVGAEGSGNPVPWVEYYYFEGDTIIDGKTCKQMMCQQYVNQEYADYENVMKYPQLSYVGAWYEENKKVYFYNARTELFILWYDFSANVNDSVQIRNQQYVMGPKQTGDIKGFKGVYRNVMWGEENHYNTTWLEGVGSIEGPIHNVYLGKEYHACFLMSCTVGDEVIYFNEEYEDGATPEGVEARKRIDFTHTIKIKPKARREEAEPSLYGEYNDLQLGINLNALDDAYEVRITDETGKTVYEKTVNAGNIVGLNIDISAYAEGRYTVTVENDNESFTGQFETQTTGISDAERLNDNGEMINDNIYNLQGQRISAPRKGLNIVSGRKVFVK